ncbi:hypothetical protein P5673_003554 [Acropora cervicornis]|uniref:Uncharacterized protein n=1 Tax=Acropora cervicornis TaxID=6130 RepID=A0AAD9R1F1_ACRCE|nr:hypothetical protein P5673_003554 [Acropora cervicornis]
MAFLVDAVFDPFSTGKDIGKPLHNLTYLEIFASVNFTVMVTEDNTNPKYSIDWDGTMTDFLGTPILTLAFQLRPDLALNPSLLQYLAKDARAPMRDFHVFGPKDVGR